MRTLFVNAPFAKHRLGWDPAGPPALSQAATEQQYAFSVIGEILRDVGISESDINSLLNKIPPETAGPYRAKFEECKKMGVTTTQGAACVVQLYREIKEAKPEAARPPSAPRPAAAPSAFPVVPVLIGVAAAGGLVYFLATRGK